MTSVQLAPKYVFHLLHCIYYSCRQMDIIEMGGYLKEAAVIDVRISGTGGGKATVDKLK
jgi:hypothetical protein